MDRYFTTSREGKGLERDEPEWDRVLARFQEQVEAQREVLPPAAIQSISNYGKRRPYFERGDYEAGRILSPAGSWAAYRLYGNDEMDSGRFSIGFWARQVEIARYGLDDLYEAALFIHHGGQNSIVSKLIAVTSVDEAHDRFMSALTSPVAEEMAKSFADDPRARAFGVASSPTCIAEALAQTPVYRDEVNKAVAEIEAATGPLLAALDSLEGTDVGQFIDRRSRLGRLRKSVQDALDRLPKFDAPEPEKRKRGRPQRGGVNLIAAHALASLWTRCGLGEPKVSPQSRFIRACSIALPRLGIYKADVAQFMKGELRKPKPAGVLIP